MSKQPLTLYLAAPRGFCAGVDRAIKIVEMAIERWGAPVYVRHEIVHNRYVVDRLRDKGAIFVEELEDCPPDRPVIFSAHGVPKAVGAEAARRDMVYVDATCPLVSKVHIEAARHHEAGLQMVMIGHDGHPETIGTMGQLPPGEVLLVETVADVARIAPRDSGRLAFITQTTLSVDDTAGIVAALKARFPAIVGPHKEDICYATTNRQEAVKAMAPLVDALLVVGAPNSSNSRRLVEVGSASGCGYAQLVQRADDVDWRALDGARSVGLTAGASAPEVLVEEVVDAFRDRYGRHGRGGRHRARGRRVQGPPRAARAGLAALHSGLGRTVRCHAEPGPPVASEVPARGQCSSDPRGGDVSYSSASSVGSKLATRSAAIVQLKARSRLGEVSRRFICTPSSVQDDTDGKLTAVKIAATARTDQAVPVA